MLCAPKCLRSAKGVKGVLQAVIDGIHVDMDAIRSNDLPDIALRRRIGCARVLLGGAIRGTALRLACRGRCGRSGVLDGKDKDQVARLIEAVDHQHPSPGSEDEAHRVPTPVELPADAGELLKCSE